MAQEEKGQNENLDGGLLARRLRERMDRATSQRLAHKAAIPTTAVNDTPEQEQAAELSPAEEVSPEQPIPASVEVRFCAHCTEETVADHTCHRCERSLCSAHSYSEAEGGYHYCRDCADQLVGVCAICDALHARPCRTCGIKVCDNHAHRVIERWGWGGAPGQGGVTDWFPILRTYCQEHGHDRVDAHKPTQKTFTGFDASSPEW